MDSANQLVSTLEGWFKQLPALPANAVDGLVTFSPWIALIFGILGIIGGISSFGLLSMFAPVAVIGGAAGGFGMGFIAALIWLVSSVLLLLAYPGLKAKKKAGWMMFFWSQIVSAVATILTVSVGGVVGVVIGLYLLFQIKAKYN